MISLFKVLSSFFKPEVVAAQRLVLAHSSGRHFGRRFTTWALRCFLCYAPIDYSLILLHREDREDGADWGINRGDRGERSEASPHSGWHPWIRRCHQQPGLVCLCAEEDLGVIKTREMFPVQPALSSFPPVLNYSRSRVSLQTPYVLPLLPLHSLCVFVCVFARMPFSSASCVNVASFQEPFPVYCPVLFPRLPKRKIEITEKTSPLHSLVRKCLKVGEIQGFTFVIKVLYCANQSNLWHRYLPW